jgi:DNA-directed RNA polymerase omega subunit
METSPSISLDNIDNRFLFVLLSAKRALQLQRGAKARVDVGTKKSTVIAMHEVLDDKVQFETPQKVKGKRSHK